MRHVIVEPHVDDAFLSLGGHIEEWRKGGDLVTIVSVYSDAKRDEDAARYANAVGAECFQCGFEATNGGADAEARNTGRVSDGLLFVLSDFDPDETKLYAPVGLGHAEHVQISDVIRARGFDFLDRSYYLDQPYASVQKNRDQVRSRLLGSVVVSFLRPPKTKYRHIPLFKTQGKYFHFNPEEKLETNIELILK